MDNKKTAPSPTAEELFRQLGEMTQKIETLRKERDEARADAKMWMSEALNGFNDTNSAVKETRTRDTVREELAAYAHEAWSGWMRYLFSKCYSNDAGELTIPAWAVARWTRQMSTPYWDLPIGEPDSDRAEADKMLAIFEKE